MEPKTREKLRDLCSELDKLDEETKAREAEVWCLSALSILCQDTDFQRYCEEDYQKRVRRKG